MLSTIQSPTFTRVEVLYEEQEFFTTNGKNTMRGPTRPRLHRLAQDAKVKDPLRRHKLFELFRELSKVRKFWLALHAYVCEDGAEIATQMLKEAVVAMRARWGPVGHFPEPSVGFISSGNCRLSVARK
jgi:hypothetical protein